ncbi:hypothetical protein BH23VER1_BH23VER1_11550 [soil metagenome]
MVRGTPTTSFFLELIVDLAVFTIRLDRDPLSI